MKEESTKKITPEETELEKVRLIGLLKDELKTLGFLDATRMFNKFLPGWLKAWNGVAGLLY